MDSARVAWGEVTIDCVDAQLVSAFWGELLEMPVQVLDLPGWCRIGPTVDGGPVINFQPVPEPKSGKTRIHLDIWTADVAAAIARVLELGGRQIKGPYSSPVSGTVVVMADREGNEFCLVGMNDGDR